MAKPKHDWRHNAATGSYILDVNRNTRVIRDGDAPGALYRCEFWGDYSLKYPVKGAWTKSLPAAMKSCSALRRRALDGARRRRQLGSGTRKPTIYEALRAKLGREPTQAEVRADVRRIIREGADVGLERKLKRKRR